jgi:hypothetical protein
MNALTTPPLAAEDLPWEIRVNVDRKLVNDEAIRALAAAGDVYQRSGQLVRVRKTRKAGRLVPSIEPIPGAALGEKLSQVCRFIDGRGAIHVPDWCVPAVQARGEWDGVPHLAYAVEYPVLRPDGTVLQRTGYDEATQIFYCPSGAVELVPERPTYNEMVDARERLLDLVVDFPFSQPCHRSAWLAGVLTPFARPAYDGATPFFLVDANVRGAGKSFLCDVASLISTGRRMPKTTQAADEAEEGKRITAVARAGETVKLIDNISRPFGNGKFDAALTTTWWEDRLLGANDMYSGPLFCIWWGTGNNVQFAPRADTARRTLHIRLLSPDQNPEHRTTFKYPHLARYVTQHRARLMADCLTLLRYYELHKDSEQLKLKPWGSFEEWSELVRGTLVLCGLPDPIEAHEQLAELADTSANFLADLVAGWREMCEEQRVDGCTVREAISWLAEDLEYKSKNPGHRLRFTRLLDAVVELCGVKSNGLPDPQKLGFTLRSFRGRVTSGEYLETDTRSKQGQLWTVKKR